MCRLTLVALVLMLAAPGPAIAPALAQEIDFGDNSSDYARNGVCDDRRFRGPGVAAEVDWYDAGRDADDCREALASGRAQLWQFDEAVAATRCDRVEFGDDSGGFPDDGECDDPRFEGMAVDGILTSDYRGRDATDCRRLCEMGLIGLRDY